MRRILTKIGCYFCSRKIMMTESSRILAQNRTLEKFCKEKEGTWKGPFCFIQAADTQFGMIDSYIKKLENPEWEKEIQLTRQAIEAVHLMTPRPRFFVVCGDLVDAMPGTKDRNGQEQDFFKVFAELHPDIPLVCVCGNHDVGNTPTPDSIKSYKDRFGDDYFTFYCGGVKFIALNSQFFEDPSQVLDLANEQETWLEEQLEDAKSGNYKHIVIFQHIPLFTHEAHEENHYFSLDKDIRMRLLTKFYEAKVRKIFCGHYHRNAGGFYKYLEVIVTSAIGAQLGNDKSGFRVVKVLDSSITHQYYALEEAPKTIQLES